MPPPDVQPFDLPVPVLLPFDVILPDPWPPRVVLLFRLHLLHRSPLLGRSLHDKFEFIAPPPFTKDFRVWCFLLPLKYAAFDRLLTYLHLRN
jgi:hypothetical protein